MSDFKTAQKYYWERQAQLADEKIDGFKEEELNNDQFHAPKEDISVSIDVEEIPSLWKRIKGWLS